MFGLSFGLETDVFVSLFSHNLKFVKAWNVWIFWLSDPNSFEFFVQENSQSDNTNQIFFRWLPKYSKWKMNSYDISELALDKILRHWKLVKSKEIPKKTCGQSGISAIFEGLHRYVDEKKYSIVLFANHRQEITK